MNEAHRMVHSLRPHGAAGFARCDGAAWRRPHDNPTTTAHEWDHSTTGGRAASVRGCAYAFTDADTFPLHQRDADTFHQRQCDADADTFHQYDAYAHAFHQRQRHAVSLSPSLSIPIPI